MDVMIIDDEIANIENLSRLLQQQDANLRIVATADSIEDARDKLMRYEPDLVFLDIVMGHQTSFDLLKMLPRQDFELIFVTAYDQFGIQAVKFSAIDYLLKPIDPVELQMSVAKVTDRIQKQRKNKNVEFLLDVIARTEKKTPKIVLPLGEEIRYVSVADIVYCESSNTYTYFHLQTGEKVLVSKPLKEYDDMLNPYGFVRTHQSFLVNMEYVRSYVKGDGGYLRLHDKSVIPISKARREYVKQALK